MNQRREINPKGTDDKDLVAENERLLQENQELARRTENVATANTYAAELMVLLEESNEQLAAEIEKRKAAERRLQQVNAEIEAKVKQRTSELANANERLIQEINQREEVEQTLREHKQRLDTILSVLLTGVMIVDAETHEIVNLNSLAVDMIGLPKELIIGRVCYEFICPAEEGQCPVGDLGQAVNSRECVLLKPNGQEIPILKNVTKAFWQGREYFVESFVDMTEQKRAQEELGKTHERLLEASRMAGMAEVATDILHNVGNVLNSINISASSIRDTVMNSKVLNLRRVTDMITDHTDDLGAFLTEDERGKQIPLYLTEAAKIIVNEHSDITEKLRLLTKNIDHIKQIIQAQQGYAKGGGFEVLTTMKEVIKDAVAINYADLRRDGVEVKLELAEIPKIHLDRQRVLQILINLISNGKYALSYSQKQEKLLTIRCYRHSEDRLWVEVADNGVGIAKENMARIFQHGFTTKKHGHGFGLHSSALAAKEMGGSLTVHSDGLEQGATFTLELPLKGVTNLSQESELS